MRVLLLVVVTATGCFTQTTAGATFARGHVTGGAAEVAVGDLAVRGTAELVAQHLPKDDGSTTFGVLYGGALRISIPGLIWKTEDWARWVDVGGDLGVGAGLHGTSGFVRAYAGGWMDIRLRPGTERYPTLRVQARRAVYTGEVSTDTELMVGLGWTVNDTGWIPRGFE